MWIEILICGKCMFGRRDVGFKMLIIPDHKYSTVCEECERWPTKWSGRAHKIYGSGFASDHT